MLAVTGRCLHVEIFPAVAVLPLDRLLGQLYPRQGALFPPEYWPSPSRFNPPLDGAPAASICRDHLRRGQSVAAAGVAGLADVSRNDVQRRAGPPRRQASGA